MASKNDAGGSGRGSGSVRSAALWAAGSQYCLFAIQFATSVIISRFFLKPDEIGLFSVALAAAMMFTPEGASASTIPVTTLADVVAHYNTRLGLNLSAGQQLDLVEFLKPL